jgi:hypothetical protein
MPTNDPRAKHPDNVPYGSKESEQSMDISHPHTDQCGFDRNSSISEDTYVCMCGWRASNAAGQVPETARPGRVAEAGSPPRDLGLEPAKKPQRVTYERGIFKLGAQELSTQEMVDFANSGWAHARALARIADQAKTAQSATPAMPTEDEIRLAAGEMTAREMRTVKAVLAWFIRRVDRTAKP